MKNLKVNLIKEKDDKMEGKRKKEVQKVRESIKKYLRFSRCNNHRIKRRKKCRKKG